VGLVGVLGQGNLGNDGSLEAVLAYLDAEHPDAILDFLCTGTDQMMARYGVPETRLRWYNTQTQRAPGVTVFAAKSLMVPLGMIVDAFRIGTWVRCHDVLMVPGMGVIETSLRLRSWHTHTQMFLVSAFGRLFGTKVALVSVGPNDIRQPLARRLVTAAARLAYYRSFRDTFPRDAMRRMGLNTSGDAVYPDLAFALPTPRDVPVVVGMAGVGVMDCHGSNDDRRQAGHEHTRTDHFWGEVL
jgi:polysaccharide pyruvyl transferase WcaK-like protein